MAQMKATRAAYGEALAELGAENDKLVVLDADLSHSTMTAKFADKFPGRFFNAGIAEANMVSMSAGLSTMGLVPFCSSFAIFGTGRAYEQIRNSVAHARFNVKIATSHAGVTLGEDGGSHQAFEDIALMRVIPGMTVVVPCDANETKRAVRALAAMDGPAYLRLARLASPVFEQKMPFTLGKANLLREGGDLAVFVCGLMVPKVLDAAEALAAEGIEAAVINVHTVKPIDAECVREWAGRCKKVLTVEEHSVIGGLGDAVADVLIGHGDFAFEKVGIQDRFGQSGSPDELLEEYGLSTRCITERMRAMAKR